MRIPIRNMIEVNLLGVIIPVYFVDEIPNSEDWMGLSSFKRRHILLRTIGQGDFLDTFIHELCHFFRYFGGLHGSFPTNEEQVCCQSSGLICCLVRANGVDFMAKFMDAVDLAVKNASVNAVFHTAPIGNDGFLDC